MQFINKNRHDYIYAFYAISLTSRRAVEFAITALSTQELVVSDIASHLDGNFVTS